MKLLTNYGMFDDNMDTAIALNSHGGFSQGQGGIAGNFEVQ